MGVTLALGLVAFTTGVNLLYLMLAMLLSFLLCSGILSELTMRRLVIRQIPPRRIYAGSAAPFHVVIGNAKRALPSYALSVNQRTAAGGRTVSHYLLKLSAGESAVLKHSLTAERRGWHRLPGARLSTRFPFGLFTKTWRPPLDQSILVFPAVRGLAMAELSALGAARLTDRDGARRGQSAGLHSLRRYRHGDDPRLIHWKTSARVGSLTLKELEDEDRPRISLTVEDPAPGTPPDLVEANISLAASMAVHAIHRGWEIQLVLADSRTELRCDDFHLDWILERLALYEVPARPRPLPSSGAAGEIRVRLDAPTHFVRPIHWVGSSLSLGKCSPREGWPSAIDHR
jgi:uncharacterized protein (DUF58 family)